MPTAEAVEEPAVVEDVGQLDDPDEPPGGEEIRPNGQQGARAGIMKPLVVLALPGMYLFYKYSQYRREQRELSRRRITERELQHLHHKIDKLLTKLEENEPEMASSQEDETAQQGMQMPPMMGGMRVGQYDGMAGGMQSGRGGVMMGSYGAKDDQGGNMGGMDDMRQISAMGRMRRVSEGLNGKATKSESSEVSGKSLERNETLKNDTAMDVSCRCQMVKKITRRVRRDNRRQCVICVNARATMQTAPCGHRVVCRRCFVKTIQMAVSQRLLPLRCVICRAKILRLKQTLIPRDYSMSGKSWVLPQSASEYNIGSAGVGTSGSGPGGRWGTGSVPASASLYSMASGSSSISGVSSVSSATSSSASSAGSSSMSKPMRLRQPTGATFRKTQTQSMKMRIQEYQEPSQQIAEDDDAIRDNRERRLPPIKEFQRDYRAGKASTRLRCAQKIVTQLEISPTHRVPPSNPPAPSSSSSSASTRASTKRPSSAPRTVLTVAQEVQKSKKEKEKEKEREKAEKARQKEEEKAEKARAKEAKKLAKEEKKRAKKEAKARRKEAEEALLRDDK